MIIKFYSFLKAVHYTIWLGLLTLFLVITIPPVTAHANLRLGHGQDFQSLSINSASKILNTAINHQENLTSPPTPLLQGEGSNTPPFPRREGGLGGLGHHFGLVAQNPKSTPSTLLEQGRNLYEAGRFSEAAEIWQQAVKACEDQGDRLNQALALSYLSNAYQELGQWEQAQSAIASSLNFLQTQQTDKNSTAILAQALNTQGSLQLAMGQTEAALNTWQLAEKKYAQIKDETGILGSQINQAQALQTLGLYRRAQITLEQVNQKLLASPDSRLKAIGLRSLGIALRVVGDVERSQTVLEQGLAIARRLNSSTDVSSLLFSLANTAKALQDLPKALELYQQAAETATSAIAKLEAQLNQLRLLIETKQWANIQSLLPQIQSEVANLSPSRDSVYAQVNLTESLMKLGVGEEEQGTQKKSSLYPLVPSPSSIAQQLAEAVQQSRMLKDPRAQSYSLGQLGQLYKQTQQWSEAQNVTQQALILAQGIRADDIAARWQAQLGEILKQQGDIPKAIAAYTEAVKTLQSLRSDLVAINPDAQFSFRDRVEPVYRELVGLLLQFNPSQENIKQARELIEALQLAELENFFREACLRAKPQQIEQIDKTAAVIYPIILSDRLEVILSIPGRPLRHYATQLPQSDIEETLDELLASLNPFFSDRERLRLSQEVYNWLIRAAEADLAANQVKTLVFILDGSLRNLPMAALHDGKYYLVEKYSIALTPGLQLLEARSLSQQRLKILTAGLTEARQGFSALPGVKLEVQQIASEVPSKVFLNQDFTEKNLQNQIETTAFPVVHLATHGQFSSNPEQTFILTWDEKIKVKELEDLLRSSEQARAKPIELLVLSACQTAAGDKRATLGLAGVALRSGARSTLATLWSVKDQSTAKFMTEFYQQLSQGVDKAQSLRAAQLELLKQPKYQHPFYWAPFILVGNWL